MTKLLINEHPLQVLPSLAVAIGLNEAIFLQQLHYWLNNEKSGVVVDGQKWVWNTVDNWQADNFPFWGRNTIVRTVANLTKDGLIKTRSDLNKARYDKTKWYTIDYDRLKEIEKAITQNGLWVKRLSHNPKWVNRLTQNGLFEQPKMGQPIPETPTEITTETSYSSLQTEPKSEQQPVKEEQKKEASSLFFQTEKELLLQAELVKLAVLPDLVSWPTLALKKKFNNKVEKRLNLSELQEAIDCGISACEKTAAEKNKPVTIYSIVDYLAIWTPPESSKPAYADAVAASFKTRCDPTATKLTPEEKEASRRMDEQFEEKRRRAIRVIGDYNPEPQPVYNDKGELVGTI